MYFICLLGLTRLGVDNVKPQILFDNRLTTEQSVLVMGTKSLEAGQLNNMNTPQFLSKVKLDLHSQTRPSILNTRNLHFFLSLVSFFLWIIRNH